MTAVVISGCAPWDGRYEFDDFGFTNRELYEIRKISGLRAGELIEGLEANDTSAYVGVAAVVLARHGKIRLDGADVEDLWNAKVGAITIELGDQSADDDADPPLRPPAERPDDSTPGSGGGSESDGV